MLSDEQSEEDDLDWDQSECSSDEECIDYMPVWEPSTPLDHAQDDSSLLEVFDNLTVSAHVKLAHVLMLYL